MKTAHARALSRPAGALLGAIMLAAAGCSAGGGSPPAGPPGAAPKAGPARGRPQEPGGPAPAGAVMISLRVVPASGDYCVPIFLGASLRGVPARLRATVSVR